MRLIGTTIRGIRAPIINEGDNITSIIIQSILKAVRQERIVLKNKDVVGITESVVARAQGNYATVEQIAAVVNHTFSPGLLGVVFPILSRNRFSTLLRGIALSGRKLIIQLSYPTDEVGNSLFDSALLEEYHIDPQTDVFLYDSYKKKFGQHVHIFTGVNYVELYKKIVKEARGISPAFIFSNNPETILDFTTRVLACDIHTRIQTASLLRQKSRGGEIRTLADLLNKPIGGSGFNRQYGLLGSNKATEDRVKLFPNSKEAQEVVDEVAKQLSQHFGKQIEVFVYGDGAFKDPVGKIWELADPVVSPACTEGLIGTPNELKIKYLADTQLVDLPPDKQAEKMKKMIVEKDANLVGNMLAEGTTPRQLTDLLGSLCDLTSGSGDKGTPIVLVQGYFDNFATE